MRKITVLLYLFAIIKIGSAQNFEVTRVSNFPKNIKNINSIEFTENGIGWFATGRGLLKYSNNSYTKFNDPENPLLYQINKLLITDNSTVWAGNYSSELLCFKNDKLVKTVDFKGLIDNKKELITSVTQYDDQIWAATSEGNLLSYTLSSQKKQSFRGPEECIIYAIYLDSIGTKWVGTSDGLYFKMHNKKWKRIPQFAKVYGIVTNKTDTWAMGKDDNNQGLILYKLDYDLMIFFLSVERSQWQDMMFLGTDSKKIRFYDMDFDSKGNIWVGTDNGLILYDPVSGQAVYVIDENLPDFETKNIKIVAVESDNTIWAACSGNELYKVKVSFD